MYYACCIGNMVEMKISLLIFLLLFTMAVTLARTNIIEQEYKLSLHNCSYVDDIYTQTKVKQHHIFSETLFWKLQNGICG